MLQFLEKLKSLPALQALKKLPLRERLKKLRMNRGVALGLVCLLLALALLIRPGTRELPPESSEPPVTAPETSAPPATEPPAPPVLAGAVEVRELHIEPEESVFGLCRTEDGAAVLLLRWDEDVQVWRSRLAVLDPETAAPARIVELEPFGDILGLSTLEVTDTEIRFVDETGERCAAFDREGRFLGLPDHPVMSKENLGWRNRLLGDDVFYKKAGWAEINRSDSGELSRVVAFYDEQDKLHVLSEPYDEIRDVYGHRLLTLGLPESGEQELAILDLDAKLCLDRLSFRAEDRPGAEWTNLAGAVLGEDWALLCVSWEAGAENERVLYFWYPEAEGQSPLEDQILTEQALWDGIGALGDRLAEAGLILHLDEAPETWMTPTTGLTSYENTCETGASLFGQYWVLSALADFVDKLPAGMVREMTRDLPGGDLDGMEGLQVYLVRNIPGSAAAFANAWTESPMVCFATEEFNPSHLAHEFMHVMDLRLSRWLEEQRQDLDRAWRALSPDYAYEEELSQEQSDALDSYFVSWYARTNPAEDRAETFQALFDSEEPVAEAWWYAEHPGAQAKARWLAEKLRAAFPSVQAAESVWWEKLPAEPEPEPEG
jgi:hypothetical protein